MLKRLALLLPATLLLPACSTSHQPPPPAPGTQTPQHLDKTVPHHVTYDYLLYLPPNYTPTQTYPLVIFLHGAGERGSNLNQLKLWGPPALVAAGQQFNFILAAPQCPKGQWWHIDDLEVLLQDLRARYPIDPSRLYLTGLSMGGCATYDWLLRSPHTFAAAVPVCGWGNPPLTRLAPPDTAVWAFHGESDPVVPVAGSRDMIAALQSAHRAEAKLTTYPHVGHNAWSPTYSNPDVFPWLLSHRLPNPSPQPASPR